MIGLVGAVRQELGELRRRLGLLPAASPRGTRLYRGRVGGEEVLLAQTGIGRLNAERATRYLLRRPSVRLVVALGFGGGLSPLVRAGELVLCLRLHCDAASESCCRPDPGFLSLAARASSAERLRVRLGNSVTVERLVTRPGDKLALGLAFGAQAVDMESFWVARVAGSRSVPFLGVRAISDPLSQTMPPLDRLIGPDGNLCWARALARFARHPAELGRLPQLGRNAHLAAASLADFVGALFRRL